MSFDNDQYCVIVFHSHSRLLLMSIVNGVFVLLTMLPGTIRAILSVSSLQLKLKFTITVLVSRLIIFARLQCLCNVHCCNSVALIKYSYCSLSLNKFDLYTMSLRSCFHTLTSRYIDAKHQTTVATYMIQIKHF